MESRFRGTTSPAASPPIASIYRLGVPSDLVTRIPFGSRSSTVAITFSVEGTAAAPRLETVTETPTVEPIFTLPGGPATIWTAKSA